MYRGLIIIELEVPLLRSPREPQSLPGSMDVEFAELSDRGQVREGNEDYLGHVAPEAPQRVRSHGWLFVLADGVGGQDVAKSPRVRRLSP